MPSPLESISPIKLPSTCCRCHKAAAISAQAARSDLFRALREAVGLGAALITHHVHLQPVVRAVQAARGLPYQATCLAQYGLPVQPVFVVRSDWMRPCGAAELITSRLPNGKFRTMPRAAQAVAQLQGAYHVEPGLVCVLPRGALGEVVGPGPPPLVAGVLPGWLDALLEEVQVGLVGQPAGGLYVVEQATAAADCRGVWVEGSTCCGVRCSGTSCRPHRKLSRLMCRFDVLPYPLTGAASGSQLRTLMQMNRLQPQQLARFVQSGLNTLPRPALTMEAAQHQLQQHLSSC